MDSFDLEKFIEEHSKGLDKIDVFVYKGISCDKLEILPKQKITISTWMSIYKNLKTLEQRLLFREAAENIAGIFRTKKIFKEHGTFNAKFELSMPYNLFLSTVDELEETYKQPYSVSFHEVIDYSVGEIIDSLHFTRTVELTWIISEYMVAGQQPKMTILYHELADSKYQNQIPFDIDVVKVEVFDEFQTQHSRLSILKYKDNSIRIIISNVNLHHYSWETMTQGLWISPVLPHLSENAEDTDGESVTNFKKDLIAFLDVYKQPQISEWKLLIRKIDFSAIKVFLLASVPGHHKWSNLNSWGHRRLYTILSEHATLPSNSQTWPVVAQSSNVGVFGQCYQNWLLTHIVHPMARERNKRIIRMPDFKFVYPTQESYEESFDKQNNISCLIYNKDLHSRQKWIKQYLYHWKFERTNRNGTMPHCKCYTRISPDETEIPWFILTSANCTKGAWGKMIEGGFCQYICNYELGVVFIPQIMINQRTFPIKESNNPEIPVFMIPYDLPLKPYGPNDEPKVV